MTASTIQVLQALGRYNAYANQALLQEATQLSLEQLAAAQSPSRETALKLFTHLLTTEAYFLAQCQGLQFEPALVASLEQLRLFAEGHTAALLAYVLALDEAGLARQVEIEMRSSRLHYPVWQVLTQVFLHSAQHRGELSVLLSQLGHPLPIEDIILRFTEESGQVWPRKAS